MLRPLGSPAKTVRFRPVQIVKKRLLIELGLNRSDLVSLLLEGSHTLFEVVFFLIHIAPFVARALPAIWRRSVATVCQITVPQTCAAPH